MKVSMENDNNFGNEKITILVDNMPLIPMHVNLVIMDIFFVRLIPWISQKNFNLNSPCQSSITLKLFDVLKHGISLSML